MSGYSGTPLAKKLGIKDASRVCVINPPPNYLKLVAPLPRDASIGDRLSGDTDIIHVFTTKRSELAKRLASLRTKIQPEAAIWVSWPKKASGQPTDITEDTIREVALPIGLVDVKVCAVDETWSGLKLVIRKELRPKRQA
jgi:Protein of unknown function (DUF3052)